MSDKELIKQLRKSLEKKWGKKCKKYCPTCCVCEVYRALESLEYFTEDQMNKELKEIEKLSSKFHDIYQEEAKRQSDLGLDEVRHPDKYEDLPERTKEYDRVLARYVIDLIDTARAEERELLREKCEKRKEIARWGGNFGGIAVLDDLLQELNNNKEKTK